MLMRVRQDKPFEFGCNTIVSLDDPENRTMMDFSILKLGQGHSTTDDDTKEKALLLLRGEVTLEWDGRTEKIGRKSCFDENPWVLHVDRETKVKVTGAAGESEVCVIKTANDSLFEAKLFTDKECRSEERGKGTMNETSTRIVRTVFDYSNAGHSKLVLGEVIDFPGKWSSYPPHYHPQPEIYFYRFTPENGYGFCQLGDSAVQVKHNDTVQIFDVTHPQVTAPGYAMYYLWVIRHLDENPYIDPVFEPEHLWTTDEKAKFWPDKP